MVSQRCRSASNERGRRVLSRWAASLALASLLGVADAARAGPATATVLVEVPPVAGRSLVGAVVEVQAIADRARRWSRLIADTQNSAAFDLVPPGTYRITVSLAGFSNATLDVQVGPSTLVALRADEADPP